ncbi:hypothetical protein BGW38_000653, partial [Lunasporangiospora selenospora]
PPAPGESRTGNSNSNSNGNGNSNGIGRKDGDEYDSESSHLNISAIAGGVGGGAALISLVALFFFIKHKRSSLGDDYSKDSGRGSQSSESENEDDTRYSMELSTMYKERGLPSRIPRDMRSPSSTRSRHDIEYHLQEQAVPLRHAFRSDREPISPMSREYVNRDSYEGVEAPSLPESYPSTAGFYSSSSSRNHNQDQERPQPRYSPTNNPPTTRSPHNNGRDYQPTRVPTSRSSPDRQPRRPSHHHLYDQQSDHREVRAPQYESSHSGSTRGSTRGSDNNLLSSQGYSPRPRDPQIKGSYPLDHNYIRSQPGDPQFGTAYIYNPPHGTPAFGASWNNNSRPRDSSNKISQPKNPHRNTLQPFIPHHSETYPREPQAENT